MADKKKKNEPASQAAADDSSSVYSSSNSSHDSKHPGPLPTKEKLGDMLLDLGGFVLDLFAAARKHSKKSVHMAADLSPWKRLHDAALPALQQATRHNIDQGLRCILPTHAALKVLERMGKDTGEAQKIVRYRAKDYVKLDEDDDHDVTLLWMTTVLSGMDTGIERHARRHEGLRGFALKLRKKRGEACWLDAVADAVAANEKGTEWELFDGLNDRFARTQKRMDAIAKGKEALDQAHAALEEAKSPAKRRRLGNAPAAM